MPYGDGLPSRSWRTSTASKRQLSGLFGMRDMNARAHLRKTASFFFDTRRVVSVNKRVFGARLDLHEHEAAGVPRHDVDFAVPASEISGDDFHSLARQKFCGGVFAQPAYAGGGRFVSAENLKKAFEHGAIIGVGRAAVKFFGRLNLTRGRIVKKWSLIKS